MTVERVLILAGTTDGVNTTFTTPSKYESGTIRVISNGSVYEANDTRKGWSEIDDQTIQLFAAPLAGDVLQAFYQEKNTGAQIGVEGVVGSPFHPTGLLP